MTLLTLLKPRARPAIDRAEVIARRLGMPQVAEHYDYLVRKYLPGPDGRHLMQLFNPDTGQVGLEIDDDPAEAFRRLAEPFADDL